MPRSCAPAPLLSALLAAAAIAVAPAPAHAAGEAADAGGPARLVRLAARTATVGPLGFAHFPTSLVSATRVCVKNLGDHQGRVVVYAPPAEAAILVVGPHAEECVTRSWHGRRIVLWNGSLATVHARAA
ncbi:MAG TPA: hypothetical protein VFY17_10945 [Pilimelia sp.]|nr:hypothetical protein [Pilimelia sp.]